MKHRMALASSLLLSLAFAYSSHATAQPVPRSPLPPRIEPPSALASLGGYVPRVIFDTDMITDFDDVGALACLHALADAGECEILATVSSTRGNASVGAIEVINHYYGRSDLPVGAPKGMGVMGAHPGAKTKVDPAAPLGEKKGGDGGHYKYRKMLADYPGWYRYADADAAPDANEVYRRVLAAQPDGSVTICSVGFLTNLRRLLETKPDDISLLDGKELVAKKVKLWVAMACKYPKGKEYNSKWDAASSRIVLENWPTPAVFSAFDYGRNIFSGRAMAESAAEGRTPVRDIFAENLPTKEQMEKDPAKWHANCYGPGGRSSWDETAVLIAVRGWRNTAMSSADVFAWSAMRARTSGFPMPRTAAIFASSRRSPRQMSVAVLTS